MPGIGSYDDKKGLGYGSLGSQNNKPRKLSNDFPYTKIDDSKDLEIDDLPIGEDELDLFVRMINLGHDPVDYFNSAGQDPFYFAAGNTKLKENSGTLKGLSPKPQLYKDRQASVGGGASPANIHSPEFNSRVAPRGSKVGWSKPAEIEIVEPDPVYKLDDIPLDDERTLIDLRKLIATIHYQQEFDKEL